jgi:hypothetical protein
MSRYIIFVIDGPGNPADANEMANIDAFNESLQKNENWVTAAGIAGSDKATFIDNRNGKNEVIQKSLQPGPEYYSGFWIIEAETDSEAHELALQGSKACNRKVELRKYL